MQKDSQSKMALYYESFQLSKINYCSDLWAPGNLLPELLLPMQISLIRKIYDEHADSNSYVYVIIIMIFAN